MIKFFYKTLKTDQNSDSIMEKPGVFLSAIIINALNSSHHDEYFHIQHKRPNSQVNSKDRQFKIYRKSIIYLASIIRPLFSASLYAKQWARLHNPLSFIKISKKPYKKYERQILDQPYLLPNDWNRHSNQKS